jgi:hypothetical protein
LLSVGANAKAFTREPVIPVELAVHPVEARRKTPNSVTAVSGPLLLKVMPVTDWRGWPWSWRSVCRLRWSVGCAARWRWSGVK